MKTVTLGSTGEDVRALQEALKILGLYKDTVDGEFGPLTYRAVTNFQKLNNLKVDGICGPLTWATLKVQGTDEPKPDTDLPSWLLKAMSYLGEKEIAGSKDNTWIEECFSFTSYGTAEHDEVPWCAAFACRVLAETGYKHTHSAAAKSFATLGVPCEPMPGAFCVKSRVGGNHVTILKEKISNSTWGCIGGNQSNSVNISRYAASDFYAVRWPFKV